MKSLRKILLTFAFALAVFLPSKEAYALTEETLADAQPLSQTISAEAPNGMRLYIYVGDYARGIGAGQDFDAYLMFENLDNPGVIYYHKINKEVFEDKTTEFLEYDVYFPDGTWSFQGGCWSDFTTTFTLGVEGSEYIYDPENNVITLPTGRSGMEFIFIHLKCTGDSSIDIHKSFTKSCVFPGSEDAREKFAEAIITDTFDELMEDTVSRKDRFCYLYWYSTMETHTYYSTSENAYATLSGNAASPNMAFGMIYNEDTITMLTRNGVDGNGEYDDLVIFANVEGPVTMVTAGLQGIDERIWTLYGLTSGSEAPAVEDKPQTEETVTPFVTLTPTPVLVEDEIPDNLTDAIDIDTDNTETQSNVPVLAVVVVCVAVAGCGLVCFLLMKKKGNKSKW